MSPAFQIFRLAAIGHGVFARGLAGVACWIAFVTFHLSRMSGMLFSGNASSTKAIQHGLWGPLNPARDALAVLGQTVEKSRL
jgi:hypothetical protein